MKREVPPVYCLIHTDLGYRAYAEKELREVFEVDGIFLDGSYILDGSWTLGMGLGLMDKGGRVISFGIFERTIQPIKRDVLESYEQKQLQHTSIVLDNEDRYFTKIIAKEPFLTKILCIYVGFESDPFAEHIKLFDGVITEISIDQSKFSIEVDER